MSASLDYAGVGPEHSWLKDSGRAEYGAVTDVQALKAMQLLARTEGIISALESSHAVYHGIQARAASCFSRCFAHDSDVVRCKSYGCITCAWLVTLSWVPLWMVCCAAFFCYVCILFCDCFVCCLTRFLHYITPCCANLRPVRFLMFWSCAC